MQQKLSQLARLLVDQQNARVIVAPQQASSGFWFGGGNMVQDAAGDLWVVGRFRNHGDSRTGLGAGERGLEMAIYRSTDRGQTFEKSLSFSKADLSTESLGVLSIEGTALRLTETGVQLFVSTEKSGIDYPAEVKSFLKPGTGVWTIDRLIADEIESLKDADVQPHLATNDPAFIHVKDPFLGSHQGDDCLLFCSHPFCWSSSNTGYVRIAADGSAVGQPCFDFFPRGFAWDVAITRGTSLMPVPQIGDFAGQDISLFFYDGGECVRNLDEHASAVKRPRGYSCEELGGVAFVKNNDLNSVQRLSMNEPMFISPHGTGCSRYVDVLVTDDGYYATWQQAQSDGSQPLVMNFVSKDAVNSLLTS
tara:strand:+ start:653527 stop:654615 length:1089 start_codon:yes stop_codon:yes gene_type:complete